MPTCSSATGPEKLPSVRRIFRCWSKAVFNPRSKTPMEKVTTVSKRRKLALMTHHLWAMLGGMKSMVAGAISKAHKRILSFAPISPAFTLKLDFVAVAAYLVE